MHHGVTGIRILAALVLLGTGGCATAESLIKQGDDALRAGRIQEAESHFEEAGRTRGHREFRNELTARSRTVRYLQEMEAERRTQPSHCSAAGAVLLLYQPTPHHRGHLPPDLREHLVEAEGAHYAAALDRIRPLVERNRRCLEDLKEGLEVFRALRPDLEPAYLDLMVAAARRATETLAARAAEPGGLEDAMKRYGALATMVKTIPAPFHALLEGRVRIMEPLMQELESLVRTGMVPLLHKKLKSVSYHFRDVPGFEQQKRELEVAAARFLRARSAKLRATQPGAALLLARFAAMYDSGSREPELAKLLQAMVTPRVELELDPSCAPHRAALSRRIPSGPADSQVGVFKLSLRNCQVDVKRNVRAVKRSRLEPGETRTTSVYNCPGGVGSNPAQHANSYQCIVTSRTERMPGSTVTYTEYQLERTARVSAVAEAHRGDGVQVVKTQPITRTRVDQHATEIREEAERHAFSPSDAEVGNDALEAAAAHVLGAPIERIVHDHASRAFAGLRRAGVPFEDGLEMVARTCAGRSHLCVEAEKWLERALGDDRKLASELLKK